MYLSWEQACRLYALANLAEDRSRSEQKAMKQVGDKLRKKAELMQRSADEMEQGGWDPEGLAERRAAVSLAIECGVFVVIGQ